MQIKSKRIFYAFVAIAATAAFFIFSTQVEAGGQNACVRKEFKTEMYKQACTKGGQKAAKDAAKKFSKDHQVKSCNQCHSKLAPSYALKADGLQQFQKLGGR